MEKILSYSAVVLVMLYLIIVGSISALQSNLEEKYKVIILTVLNYVIYCLMQYSFGFIQWTIRLNKFDWYPYKNPFCMLVIIYCIISFIILGAYYIKYKKSEYGTKKAAWFLVAIHISSILLVIFLSPFKGWF